VSTELTAKVKQATTDKQILYAKYQKIQDFNKLTVDSYVQQFAVTVKEFSCKNLLLA